MTFVFQTLLLFFSLCAHAEVTTIPLANDAGLAADGFRYEAVIYGSQAPGRWLIGSHLFGQFVKRSSDGQIVETVDMSLMPTRLRDIPLRERRPLQLLRGIVPGRNLSVNETLALTQAEGKIVGSVGPIPISPQTFHEARQRVWDVSSGAIRYRFLDTFSRFNGNMNSAPFSRATAFAGC